MMKRSFSVLIAGILVAPFFGRQVSALGAASTIEFKYKRPGVQLLFDRRGACEVSFSRPDENLVPAELRDAWQSFGQRKSLPDTFGKVKVEGKGYGVEIDRSKKFVLPTSPENIKQGLNTYVFWTVTPRGKVENVSEIVYSDNLGSFVQDTGKTDFGTTEPAFAMMLTAEPHALVARPSRFVVLVSDPYSGDNRSIKGVSDELAFNPTDAPRFAQISRLKIDISSPERLRRFNNDRDRGRLAQVNSNLRQFEYAYAEAEAFLKETDGEIGRILSEPVYQGAEDLLSRPSQELYTHFKTQALERLRRSQMQSLASARNALTDAQERISQTLRTYEELDASESDDRNQLLQVFKNTRLALQDAVAAREFAELASERLEREATEARLDLFIKLGYELGRELQIATLRRSSLEKKLTSSNDEFSKLRGYYDELTDYARGLKTYADETNEQRKAFEIAAKSMRDAAKNLKAERERVCGELDRLITRLGSKEVSGDQLTIRLRDKFLFDTAEYSIPDASRDYDLVAYDARIRLIEKRAESDSSLEGELTRLKSERDALLQRNRIKQSHDARSQLVQLATLLSIIYPDSKLSGFQFIGHTDSRDEKPYNQWLSEQRAVEVARVFFAQRLSAMDANEPDYERYLRVVEIANQLLYERRSNSDRRGFPEWWPQTGRRPNTYGGNLASSRNTAEKEKRMQLLQELNQYVTVIGRGEDAPLPGTSAEDNQDVPENRRVEIRVAAVGKSLCETSIEIPDLPVPAPVKIPSDPGLPDITIYTDDYIRIPITVLRGTQPVTRGLEKDDLKVFDARCDDNGRCEDTAIEQKDFRLEERNQPLHITLLIDESVAPRLNIESRKEAGRYMVGRLFAGATGTDRAAITSFDQTTKTRQTLTGNRAELQTALDSLTPKLSRSPIINQFIPAYTGSKIYDAVISSAYGLTLSAPDEETTAQNIVVLVTDGNLDRENADQLQTAINAAKYNRVPIYVLGVPGSYSDERAEIKNREALNRLAGETGGKYFEEASDLIADVTRLRSGYTVVYNPTPKREKNTRYRVTIQGPREYTIIYLKDYYWR